MLRCTSSLLVYIARSAIAKKHYPVASNLILATKGFQSELWLTKDQAALFGVEIKADAEPVTLPFDDGKSIQLFNAQQTTNPQAVEAQAGTKIARSVVSGERYPRDTETTLVDKKMSSNVWITDKQMAIFNVTLKDGEAPTTVSFADRKGVMQELKLYNASQTSNSRGLESWCGKAAPINARTGFRFNGEMKNILMGIAVQRNYTNPYWITEKEAQRLGVSILAPQEGVTVKFPESNELMAGTTEVEVKFFNAMTTSDPHKVRRHGQEGKFAPRSGVTGSKYPTDIAKVLVEAARGIKSASVYWLTDNQTSLLGVAVKDGENPTSVPTTDGRAMLIFNAAQTTNRARVEERFSKKKAPTSSTTTTTTTEAPQHSL